MIFIQLVLTFNSQVRQRSKTENYVDAPGESLDHATLLFLREFLVVSVCNCVEHCEFI